MHSKTGQSLPCNTIYIHTSVALNGINPFVELFTNGAFSMGPKFSTLAKSSFADAAAVVEFRGGTWRGAAVVPVGVEGVWGKGESIFKLRLIVLKVDG
jgi:hypothetical protein